MVCGKFEARDRSATYRFLTDGDADLSERSGFNIVQVKDSVLYTPNLDIPNGVARVNGAEVHIEAVPVKLA